MARTGADEPRLELVALALLAELDEPVGSVRLAEAFVDAGIPVAEATAGRYLRRLDRAGLTRPVSTRGRVITDSGRQRLAELRLARQRDEHSARIVQAITATEVEQVADLLYVRRAVEAEAARLAALRATDEERRLIVAAADANLHDFARDDTRVPSTLSYHRAVARASHNSLLIAVAMMLLDEEHEPLARILDQLTTEFDSGIATGFALAHRRTAEAIRARDPQAAEASMRGHFDRLIAGVQRHRAADDRVATAATDGAVRGQEPSRGRGARVGRATATSAAATRQRRADQSGEVA
jgi:DNA-binding FadR family transcriptional regulator